MKFSVVVVAEGSGPNLPFDWKGQVEAGDIPAAMEAVPTDTFPEDVEEDELTCLRVEIRRVA